MTTTMIKSIFRTAIFTGAVGLMPVVALADSGERSQDPATENVPDHVQAEHHGGVANGTSADDQGAQSTGGIPTHEEAEARGAEGKVSTNNQGTDKNVPDHAQAEARSLGETTR